MINDLIPIFLCGYPKSGTTLLLSLLDSHKELLVFPEELKFFQKILTIRKRNDKINFMLSETGVRTPSLGKVNYPSGKRDYSAIDGEAYMGSLRKLLYGSKSSKDMFLSVYKNWKKYVSVETDAMKYFVEKTPGNELFIDLIKKWFPNSIFIYIVRDPRDNYLTYRKLNQQPIRKFIYSWKLSTDIGLKMAMENHILIRYEDLVHNPKDIMKKICGRLQIAFNDILLIPTRNGVIWDGNSMFGDNKGKIHTSATGRYKEHLNTDEIKLIEEYLYDSLIALNYKIDYAKKKTGFPWETAMKISNYLQLKKGIVRRSLCALY